MDKLKYTYIYQFEIFSCVYPIISLHITQQNTQSLYAHGQELKFLLSNLDVKADIVWSQKTFLKREYDVSFHGYSVMRKDCLCGSRGRLVMFIRPGLSFSKI